MNNLNDVDDALNFDIVGEAEKVLGRDNKDSAFLAIAFGQMKQAVLAEHDETHWGVTLENALRIVQECGHELLCSYPVGDEQNNMFFVFIHVEENYLTVVESYNWGKDLMTGRVNKIQSAGFRYLSWDEYRAEGNSGAARPCYNWADKRTSDEWSADDWGRALFVFENGGLDGVRRKHEITSSYGVTANPWPRLEHEDDKCIFSGRLRALRCMLTFEDWKKPAEERYDTLLSRMKFIPEKYWDALNIRDLME